MYLTNDGFVREKNAVEISFIKIMSKQHTNSLRAQEEVATQRLLLQIKSSMAWC
jgi:hypothetical protein